jgi:hypothetical protein
MSPCYNILMSNRRTSRRHAVACLLSAGLCLLLVACASKEDWQDIEDCPVPLSNEELKRRCNAAFNRCLETRIQGIDSETWGHSLCPICRDMCMQQKGVWPDKLRDGRPCQ